MNDSEKKMEKNIFKLSTDQLKDIALALKDKVEEGLQVENGEVQCLPTFVYPTTQKLNGKAIVLDLGGTNYRVAGMEFIDGKPVVHPENGWKKDLSVMKTPGYTKEELYQQLADPILETKRDQKMPIGYCFSYPAESLPDGDGKLLRWSKGVDIQEMIGERIGQPFLEYLNSKTSPKFTGIKVINDTVASLFAGLTEQDYDAYIGLIVGTGTNMATFMPGDKIPKLGEEYKDKKQIPVNLESGNFVPPHLTSVDEAVDACSDSPNTQRFEKAVSGMYLGDILKAVFPFDEFEQKFDAQKLTTIISYPDLHKKRYVKVANWIYKRSAHLVAASLAGLIMVIISQNPSAKKIRLMAEGSLFWSENRKGKNYEEMVIEELQVLLNEFGLSSVKVDIDKMENANLIGTAAAALS